jgi:signal transduction histidine kinase
MDAIVHTGLTELAQLAAAALDTPMAAVNLVDEHEVHVATSVHLGSGVRFPRAGSFCHEVVATGAPLVVPDSLRDRRFADAPQAVAQGIRFYGGWPLVVDGLPPLGTICAADHRPRRLSQPERRTMELLAGLASARLRAAGSVPPVEVSLPEVPPVVEPVAVDGVVVERLRNDFIALMSHEVRTPLASIQGYVEMLLDDLPIVEPQHRRFADSIGANVQRLVRLIDQLLLTASATGGILSLRHERVELGALTEDVLEAVRPLAATAGVQLNVRLAGPAWLDGDRALLGQAVDNLVRNGVRFTAPGGRVDVTVKAAPVSVEIVDTGVGIPADEQARVFDRFFRGAYAEMHAVPGAGLGLALVKAVVEAHGGRVRLSSAPGVGTRVALVL